MEARRRCSPLDLRWELLNDGVDGRRVTPSLIYGKTITICLPLGAACSQVYRSDQLKKDKLVDGGDEDKEKERIVDK